MSKIILRDYQKDAVSAFFSNNNTGIFEMATGTGKTLTALYAVDKIFKKKNRQFLVIIVPFLHLIDQWSKDLPKIGINNFIRIAGNKDEWIPKLEDKIWGYNQGFLKRVVVIGSYKSMATSIFQNEVHQVKGNRFLVADECHYLGSPSYVNNNFSEFESKLGLSATPKRWEDDEGTTRIYKVFKKSVFEYDMEKAINNGYLTEYYYHPVPIKLTDYELFKYRKLTDKISLMVRKEKLTVKEDKILKEIVLKRSRILKTAEYKISYCLSSLSKQKDKRFTLVYCGEGQVDEMVRNISDMGIRVHRFNAEVDIKDREAILASFASGEIEVLVAIKCLDEGVDVPATKTAYFMASTSNPREFVQRRGRILRRSKNKSFSEIYDFIVLPEDIDRKIFKSIAQKEMPRFAEFSKYAIGNSSAREIIRPILEKYQLESFLDILPWEMAEKLAKEREENLYEYTEEY